MTDPQKWVRKGEPGHVVVTGHMHNRLRVNICDSAGDYSHSDWIPINKRTGGPKGYVLQGPAEAPKPRKIHDWGKPIRIDGERWGHRCIHCRLERMEKGAGGYYAFRRAGGAWEPSRLVPKCQPK